MRLVTMTKTLDKIIEEIIRDTTDTLHIVSPYVQLSKRDEEWYRVTKALNSLKGSATEIIFMIRKPGRKMKGFFNNINQLKEYASEIWLIPNLHSKCYFNGKKALITSLNFYYHSTKHNFELGVVIDKDQTTLKTINEYIEALKDVGEQILQKERTKVSVEKRDISNYRRIKIEADFEGHRRFPLSSPDQKHLGFCLSCGKKIRFDFEIYYLQCFKCYTESTDDFFVGKYCHCCGYKYRTTERKPICPSCYKQISQYLVR